MSHAVPGHNTTPMPLRSYVERLVRLEEQKREIAADIKDVKAEAKAVGFDVRVLGQMVKEAMMSADQRDAQREFEEICEVYRANLGMLGGTPLGEAARKRFEVVIKPVASKPAPEQPSEADPAEAEPQEDVQEPPVPKISPEEAKDAGRVAHQAGAKITSNPFKSTDPNRAFWDEGWCESAGSDGMDIPEA